MSVVEDELQALADAGDLSAESVVERATPVNAPLHPYLEWNNTYAGHQWRLHQARHLIASVKVTVVVNTRHDRVRKFVHVPDLGYQDREQVAEDPDAREVALGVMTREVRALIRKWHDYPEFWTLLHREVEQPNRRRRSA